MAKTYFGFAVADSMFPTLAAIRKSPLTVDEVKEWLAAGAESCCNPSHAATIAAAREKFGLNIAIPETPPRVSLGVGDSVIVMGVRGLLRLTDRHEYTAEEVEGATFAFSRYEVVS